MGFEQLAALRDQLSKAAKPQSRDRQDRPARPARPPRDAKAQPAVESKGEGASAPAAGPAANPSARPASKQAPRPAHAKRNPRPRPAVEAKPVANAKPVDPVVKNIGRLQKRFPNAFPKNPAPKVALKIGIFEDLVAHMEELKLTRAELRDAIKIWCRGNRYWSALSDNAARVDLSGEEAGRVTPEEAVRASKLEESRLARIAAKAAAVPATAGVTTDASSEATAISPEAAAAPADTETIEKAAT